MEICSMKRQKDGDTSHSYPWLVTWESKNKCQCLPSLKKEGKKKTPKGIFFYLRLSFTMFLKQFSQKSLMELWEFSGSHVEWQSSLLLSAKPQITAEACLFCKWHALQTPSFVSEKHLSGDGCSQWFQIAHDTALSSDDVTHTSHPHCPVTSLWIRERRKHYSQIWNMRCIICDS